MFPGDMECAGFETLFLTCPEFHPVVAGVNETEPAQVCSVLHASSAPGLPADVCRPQLRSFRWLRSRSTGSFAATRSGRRMSLKGRRETTTPPNSPQES